MPTPYTPVTPARPAFPWNLVKDGESYNFDSIQKSTDPAKGLFGKCMDAIAYLLARVDAIAGGDAGASVTRQSQTPHVPCAGTWSPLLGTGYYRTGSTVTSLLVIPLDAESLPHGCTLQTIELAIAPDNSHASIAGLTLPGFSLWETDADGDGTQIGTTALDQSASFTAYNLPHTITFTAPGSTVIDRGKSYALRFSPEIGGANVLANMNVYGASVTRTAL